MSNAKTIIIYLKKTDIIHNLHAMVDLKEEFPDAKTKIIVSVNSPEISQYDNLIRSC